MAPRSAEDIGWITFKADCCHCRHSFIAVAPMGITRFECSRCGFFTILVPPKTPYLEVCKRVN